MENPSSANSLVPPDLDVTPDSISKATEMRHLQQIMRDEIRLLIAVDGVALILRNGAFCYYTAEDAIKPLWLGRKFLITTCING
jgi:L-methionine (R)-S-oxide reductase